MAIWPFGRKNKKTSTPDGQAMAASKNTSPEMTRRETAREASDRSVPTLGRRPSRKDSQKRARSASRKLSKSNAPGYRNPERVNTAPPIPALPDERRRELNEKSGANKLNQQLTNPADNRGGAPSYYYQSPMSTTSLQPERFSVVREPPSLQTKRSANDPNLPRLKSSKRKADDHAREQEVKAMSLPIPMPKRPTSHQPGLLARDSRQMRGGLNRYGERPLSDVSLPQQESMQSQLSLASDHHAFKVSAFAALSPHPTIRYSGNPRSPAGSTGPSRTSTRKEKQPLSIPEETMQSMGKKRIADLADDMDAPSLRELMERDRRRLEKHRRSEHEKLQRRLERKATKQREYEAKEEQIAAQETVAPAVGETSTSKTAEALAAPTREEGTRTPESWLHDPSREKLTVNTENPFHDPVVGGSTSHYEAATPTEEREEAVLETAKAVRLSSASMSPPTSPSRHVHEPSNLSQFSSLADPEPPARLDPDRRRDSDTSNSNRFSTNWKSIFRRSDTKAKRDSADRGRVTPSEFSNTSRDSIAQQMPPSAFTRIPRARSGTPIRTQSRFREDLPELPLSPPDSRMQSPEVSGQSALPDIPGSRGNDTALDFEGKRLSQVHPAFREEVALSRHASLRATSPEGPAGANLSQSLASVDSEGSWLTGKPVKRLSGPQPRESAGSLATQLQDLRDPEDDEDYDVPGTPEAEKYMGSLTPAPDPRPEVPVVPQRRRPRIASLEGAPESSFHSGPPLNVAEPEGTWHGPVGKHPTIVRQGPATRARSREGLLNDFQTAEPASASTAESSPSNDSPVGPEGAHPFNIQRATSVELGKGHARHISAGSARLLNLPPRSSTELKRLSASSGERSPVPRLSEDVGGDVD